jgi:uncharacterized protein (DUF1778 family)
MAQEVLKGQEQILLSQQDWERFALILDDDSAPNAKLQKAMSKFKATQA